MTTPVMKKQTKLHNYGVKVSPALLEGLRSDALRAVHAIAQRQRSASGAASGKGGDSRGRADLMFKENLPMTPDDRGSVTFVDMVLVLLEGQFPWLATDLRDAVSGTDTVDQVIKLRALLLRQPTARRRPRSARA
jgi:hypothetical protein